jgi:predicted dehydrogenase
VRDPGVVVVGTGFGCVTHVRALGNAGFSVLGLVGRDPARTEERARMFGVSGSFTDLATAMRQPGVDAVTIATPPHTHAAVAQEAIAAGKHVLCEKPFARDAAEGRAVLAAADEAGIVHLLGTEFRWDPGQATLARVVASGSVGKVRMFSVFLHVPMLVAGDAEVPPWWADPDSGGGWLGAHGSQVIDQVRLTVGEIAGVSASLCHLNEGALRAEDGFVIHLRTRSGAVGVLQSTAADWGPMLIETRVSGTTGTAWIDGVGAAVWVADQDGTRLVEPAEDLPVAPLRPERLPPGAVATTYDRMIAHGLDLAPYTRLAEIFRARIVGEPPPPGPAAATFHDGVAGMAVLDAIRASAADGGAWRVAA